MAQKRRRSIYALILSILAASPWVACKSRSESTRAVESADEISAGKPVETSTGVQMQEHFGYGAALLDTVVHGDLEGARSTSAWLADYPTPPNLRAQEADVTRLRTAASAGAQAASIHDMAIVAANLALTCGDCHQKSKQTPHFADVPQPIESSEKRQHMHLHAWAADRMWEGLVGPSDDLWSRGVAALATAPLHDDEILDSASAAPDIAAMAVAVHDLGNEGSNATTTAARADVFARFVETCAECHQRLGHAR